MRFSLDRSLNIEYQKNILDIIASFLNQSTEGFYENTHSMIEFTLTRRRHLGKILIHRFRESTFSRYKKHTIKKLCQNDWVREFEAHFFYSVIKPMNVVLKILTGKQREFLKQIKKRFLIAGTQNYVLR